jgi:N-carbamoyl-L-amino-acid hydrolase
VFFTVDLRHPDDATLSAMDAALKAGVAAIAAASAVEAAVKDFWYFPPTPFAPRLVDAVREGAARLGLSHRDIVSGAGHDAVYMARVAPTAMIFVPCVGGISHNEIEDAKPEDLEAGANVLLHAILAEAGVA